MFLKATRKSLLAIAASLLAIGAYAQQTYRLPSGHESQHRDLLASQSPLIDRLKLENTQKFIQDIEDRENEDEDDDIYSSNWDNQTVNPYANVNVPDHKLIQLGKYVHPFKGIVSSEFGYRPQFGRVHKGIDLKLNVGDTIRAAFSGKIRVARYNPGGYGYFVIIRHDNGLETVYGHMNNFVVRPGQIVKAGQMIGRGGNTGRSTGPHLHFETRYMGVAINPRKIIDFDNFTTLKDTYAFDRRAAESAVSYAPRRAASYRYANKSSVYKKSKTRVTRRRARR